MAQRQPFDLARMMAEAERDTGLSDWGGEDYFEPIFRRMFGAICESLNNEAHLNERGWAGASLRLPDILRSRLGFIADRRRWPAIAAERIEKPLVVIGLPRAGTTFLQGLLGQDPDNHSTRIWEMMYPSPPPEPATYRSDPRIARAQHVLDTMGATDPEVYALHPTSATLPEECHYLDELCGLGDNLRAYWTMPAYNAARADVDITVSYRFTRMGLQNLQFRNPHARWVMKGPQYVLYLAEFLSVHPDARIIQLHRDPARIVASVTGLLLALRKLGCDDAFPGDKFAIGNVKAFARGLKTAWEVRNADRDQGRYFDVHFRQLMADPVAMARRIYAHFGLVLSAAAEDAMRAWLSTPESHGATKRYRLADYGLDGETIDKYFGEYLDRYGIEREREGA